MGRDRRKTGRSVLVLPREWRAADWGGVDFVDRSDEGFVLKGLISPRRITDDSKNIQDFVRSTLASPTRYKKHTIRVFQTLAILAQKMI